MSIKNVMAQECFGFSFEIILFLELYDYYQ